MNILTASEARARFYLLMDEVALSHEPALISGKRHNSVLVSEEDWRAIQETLFVTMVPGLKESIQEGLKTPIDQCHKNLDW